MPSTPAPGTRPYPLEHRILRGAEEGFDLQVLLDPLEEQLDLPPILVKIRQKMNHHGEPHDLEVSRLREPGKS
jgi:hypothetical protein